MWLSYVLTLIWKQYYFTNACSLKYTDTSVDDKIYPRASAQEKGKGAKVIYRPMNFKKLIQLAVHMSCNGNNSSHLFSAIFFD